MAYHPSAPWNGWQRRSAGRLSQRSDLAAAYDGLGSVYANRSYLGYAPASAEDEYSNAIGINQQSSTPLTLLGDFYAAEGQWAKATIQYNQSLSMGEDPSPRIGLGNVDLAEQNWPDALTQYRHAAIAPFTILIPILQTLITAPKSAPQIPILLQTACRVLAQSWTSPQFGQASPDEIAAGMTSLAVALRDNRASASACALPGPI